MGVNEKGLVIGNEAVFTREKVLDRALLGMDILRLALEMCSDTREALEYITSLIEKYGQGGKSGHTQNLKYHNSYIIADSEEAYILETAGRHWVYEKVRDIQSISNTLSIGSEYEGCSSQLVEHAITKGFCRNKDEFSFKKCYESKLHPHFTKGDIRRNTVLEQLRGKDGSVGLKDMKDILRSHGRRDDVASFRTGSMECICMHAGGGLITSQTTGSFVVQLKGGEVNIWATGSSIPCISVFKPLWFSGCKDDFFTEQNQDRLIDYWRNIELFHRQVLEVGVTDLGEYLNKRDKLEAELEKLAAEAYNDSERARVTQYALAGEKDLIDEVVSHLGSAGVSAAKSKLDSSRYYRWYWKQQNRRL